MGPASVTWFTRSFTFSPELFDFIGFGVLQSQCGVGNMLDLRIQSGLGNEVVPRTRETNNSLGKDGICAE